MKAVYYVPVTLALVNDRKFDLRRMLSTYTTQMAQDEHGGDWEALSIQSSPNHELELSLPDCVMYEIVVECKNAAG